MSLGVELEDEGRFQHRRSVCCAEEAEESDLLELFTGRIVTYANLS